MTDPIPNTDERWLPVPGYEGFYSISSIGRLRRELAAKGTRAGYILRLTPNKLRGGYLHVKLRTDRIGKTFRVHCLVASAFLGSRPDGYEINHIDFDRTNNAITNLEYVTPPQNSAHSRERYLAALPFRKRHKKRTT